MGSLWPVCDRFVAVSLHQEPCDGDGDDDDQAADDQNLWYWARNETGDLEAAVEQVKSINNEWASKIRTSNVHVLTKDMKEKTLTWLEEHKKSLDGGMKLLSPVLTELVSMHNQRLKRKAPVDKPGPNKKVKDEPSDA